MPTAGAPFLHVDIQADEEQPCDAWAPMKTLSVFHRANQQPSCLRPDRGISGRSLSEHIRGRQPSDHKRRRRIDSPFTSHHAQATRKTTPGVKKQELKQ